MRRSRGNWHYFLAQYLPLAALVLVAAVFLYYNRVGAELRRMQFEQRERVALGAASLSNDLEAPLRHLSILAGEATILRTISDPGPANIAAMAENFSTLMLRNPYYDQVRWIDESGMEKVRVNASSAGPVTVPATRLQDKRDRPYFIDANRLSRGDMLISPMDLNIENGKIELPHKPTVRLAVAMETTQGERKGALIINLLMTPLLERFAGHVEQGNARIMLLNGEGYWLYSTSLADEWGFMFRREETLAKRFPGIWRAISARQSGSVSGDGIWTWQRVEISDSTERYVVRQQSPWTVALNLPQKRVAIDKYRILLRLSLYTGMVLLALAMLSWQLAVSRRRRETAAHDRARTEAELSASKERVADLLEHQETRSVLASIVSSSKDAIIGAGLDDIVSSWNPGAEKLFGYSAREAIGQSVYMLVPSDRTGEEHRILDKIMQGETVSNFETVRWHRDGHLLDISVTVSPILDGEGTFVGTSYIARDITERKRLEKELGQHRLHLESLVEQQTATLRDTNRDLELALSKAESATRAKSNFLSNMSHEIRTPMNAVLGLTYLLERTRLQTDQRDLVRKIAVAGQSLLGIINDVLDVSKIEAGKLEVERMPFRLGTVLEKVINVTAPAIGDKPVKLVDDLSDVDAGDLYGDPLRLEQILVNLTSNAIKFTARGEISIRVTTVSVCGDKLVLRFAVTDTGIGIPAEKQQDIFQAFTQEDTSTTRRYGGTGLGLTICRHLVQLMDGEIGVISEPGKGSEFWFTLPFQTMPDSVHILSADKSPEADGNVAGDDRIAGARVLVVDDSEINREVARRILEAEGAQVFTAGDGREAVEWLRIHHEEVGLVLMDIQMPVMDGYSATREIRDVLHLDALPVIALTAGAFKTQQEAAESAGMNGFLSKPYNVDQIVATVRRYITPLPPAAAEVSHRDATAPALPGFDVAAALEAWGSEDVYRSFLGKFAVQYGGAGAQILAHIAAGEQSQARALTHKLRGSAGTMAMVEVHRLAGELEGLLADGAEAENCRAKAAELDTALRAALHCIGQYAAGA